MKNTIILTLIIITLITQQNSTGKVEDMSIITPTIFKGDINNDKKIDGNDAMIIYNYIQHNIGYIDNESISYEKADADNDGNLTYNDIELISNGDVRGTVHGTLLANSIKGDINNDGYLSKTDILQTIIIIREKHKINPKEECLIDYTQDGTTDEEDINKIMDDYYKNEKNITKITC